MRNYKKLPEKISYTKNENENSLTGSDLSMHIGSRNY